MAIEKQAVANRFAIESKRLTRSQMKTLAAVGTYVVALALCLLALVWVLKLQHADLRLPLTYHGDALFYHVIIKGVLDHGWFLDNGSLGMPAGYDLRDVPTSDNNLYFLLFKLISLFTSNYALALNIFFLLSFPLTTLSALYVFRHFKLSNFSALACSLLYTFLPFHFMRGQHHLFLSSYYLIPLAVMVVLWVATGRLSAKDGSRRRYWIAALVICALIGSAGYYYAFFACFFLLAAGVVAAVRRKHLRHLMPAMAMIAVVFGALALNLLPSTLKMADRGKTPIVSRFPAEADLYGMKIAQLLMPVTGHRLAPLADIKSKYNVRPLVNENDDATLGIVGGLGFLALLGWLFFRKLEVSQMAAGSERELLDHLSLFNVAAVLLGTVGGLGSLFAFFIAGQVRAYNRISIYIAFFSFFAVGLLLELWARKYAVSQKRKMIFRVLVAFMLAFGLFDQRSHRFIPDYARIRAEFLGDAEFVRKIESSMPLGAMIFQLPLIAFPENPKVNKMNDYDLARGYLHSTRLRWSYGAVRGREAQAWQLMSAAKPVNEMVETLALAGFGGIYLDRFGYADNGAKMESDLLALPGVSAMTSGNGRLAFFDLTEYQRRLKERYPAEQWEARREAALYPLLAVWQAGFSDIEGTPENSWRWCGAEGVMMLVNRTSGDQQVKMEMILAANSDGAVEVRSPFFTEKMKVDWDGRKFSRTFTLPPGEHAIRFFCDSRRILPPNDFRELVFSVENFELTPVQAAAEVKTEEKKVQAAGAR